MSQGHRRLAAIMFTDMVGYTTLGQRNESLSLALVEEQRKLVRPILMKHGGREVKTIGDAFLVEFPNAVDAVRCAYDIQRAAREFNLSLAPDNRIHLRVGLHLGEIVESQGDISGDAVNVASRIEPLAEDGGVALSQQVYDHVRNKVDFQLSNLGAKSLKNVVEPVEVYKLTLPWNEASASPTNRLDKTRIAVLPFASLSPDRNDEYFADGMTEELITSLSGISGLSVIARTSVMKYKGASKGASEVARELSTGSLVEGSVRKAGNRVRITAQLIDGQTESHVWAQNYDKQLDDIFAIQSDVARQIADVLQIRLLSSDKTRLESVATSNVEAYTLYLKGQYYFHTGYGKAESLKTAIVQFEEAIRKDPRFALAYAQIAYSYTQLGFFGQLPSREAEEKARQYAEKALSLDDKLAEAHFVKGRIHRNHDWDFERAESEFRRATELSPSYAEAYGGIALMKLFDRRFDEAISEVQRVLELDPVSSFGNGYAATVYLYAERYAEAIKYFSKQLEIDPGSTYARGNLGLAHIMIGMPEIGIQELTSVSDDMEPSRLSDLAFAYAKVGKIGDLKELLDRLIKAVSQNDELTVAIASAYANLGETDKAIEWLEKAYAKHIPYLVTSNSDFVFDSIRDDPRFQSLMKRVGWKHTT